VRRALSLVPLALALFAGYGPAAADTSPRSLRQAQVPRTDEQLVRALAKLARAGASEVCNPALLGSELGLEIGPLTEFIRDEPPPVRSQWTEQITSLADSPPIKAARFERVRSGAHGGCEIRVEYESLRLCDAPPGRLKSLIGIEPVPGPARPHGSTYGYEYWFTSRSGDKTVLLLGTSESSCTSKFLLSAGGDRV
jgi:hypothetical protein